MRSALRSRRLRRLMLAAGLALVAGIVVGIAWATIPDNGVYTGCYLKSDGTLRIVDSSADCRKNETAITWNQKGETGPPGEQGPPGPKGETGAPGVSPVAYAHVSQDVLDTSRSSNVVSMTKIDLLSISQPVYCFDLTSTPTYAVATGEPVPVPSPPAPYSVGFSTAGVTVAGTTGMNILPCESGTDAAVISGGRSFYVVFY